LRDLGEWHALRNGPGEESMTMKPLFAATLLLALATPSQAGDAKFSFGFRYHNKGLQIGIGVRKDRDACRWVPGHYETVRTKVWVPGHYKWVRRSARHCHVPGFRFGHRVRPHGHRKVWVPGHYEWQVNRAYRPGRWECARGCDAHRVRKHASRRRHRH
jgi:hypothetical protein